MRERLHLRIYLCAITFFATAPLYGQSIPDSEVVISTDRPSVANSSVVVPQGGLQFENGLLHKTELRLTVPDYYYNLPDGAGTTSGFGDLAVGVKQQLGPLLGHFNLSAIFFLSFPTGADAVSSHGYDPALQLPWSRALSAHWTLGGQVAFYWPTLAGSHNFTGETTFYLDRQLTKPWDAFVEYVGDFPGRGGSRQLLHFGTSYKLAPHHQVDFHVAVGLTHSAPDSYVGFGYSFLLFPK